MNTEDRIKGCLVGGALGDSIGSYYELQKEVSYVDFDIITGITDDTQLTLATCESILESKAVLPGHIAQKFLEWYNKGKLIGLGSSTLKALRDLQIGAHWALSGRTGEYAAGNGAAMRIAPLAFFLSISDDRPVIRDVCFITHKNDEAYVGCLSILYALEAVIHNKWKNDMSLLKLITPHLPDTLIRDNLLKLQENPFLSIKEASLLIGCSGHVVESVPLAIFAAQKIQESNFEIILTEIIRCGGDTDTNASIAGQIMGCYVGYSNIPHELIARFEKLNESNYIMEIARKMVINVNSILGN